MNVKAVVGTIAGLAAVTVIDVIAFYLIAVLLIHNMDQILAVWGMMTKIAFLHQF